MILRRVSLSNLEVTKAIWRQSGTYPGNSKGIRTISEVNRGNLEAIRNNLWQSAFYNNPTEISIRQNSVTSVSCLIERKFGDIERLTTASLTNGVTEKAFGSASNYNNPLGASYPIVKSQPSQQSQSQKSHHIGENLLSFFNSLFRHFASNVFFNVSLM